MQRSSISWTDYTSNPIRARNLATGKAGHFCVKVSRGCKNCYASALQMRYGTGVEFTEGNREKVELWLNEAELAAILRHKAPGKVFIADMTDLFQDDVPDEWILRIFEVMYETPQHTYQVLTKRPDRMRRWVQDIHGNNWPLPNVWLGVSVEDQKAANERIPELLETPAAQHFISAEPLLAPIDVTKFMCEGYEVKYENWGGVLRLNPSKLSWVICGGESAGPLQRRMDLEWARLLRDQCREAGVAFWMKQPSAYRPDRYDLLPEDLRVREFPA